MPTSLGQTGQDGMAPLPPPAILTSSSPTDMQLATPFPMNGGPLPEVPPSTPSPAEAKLKAVMGVLKKNGTGLPEEVAAVMKDNKVTDELQKIQGMHDAVENLGEALSRDSNKRALLVDRTWPCGLWIQFLHLSGLRWQEYTQQFQSQERHNLEQISHARDAVKNAQAIFRDLQERGVITIDAEGDPAMMDDTFMSTGSPIEDGLQHLTESLGEFFFSRQIKNMLLPESDRKRDSASTRRWRQNPWA